MSITIYRIRNKRTGKYLPIPRLSQTEAEISAANHAMRTKALAECYPNIRYCDTEVVQCSVANLETVLAEIQIDLGVSELTARTLLADAAL